MRITRSAGLWQVLAGALAVCRLLDGQVQPPPAFEVASIRQHEGPVPRTGGRLSISGNRLTVTSYSVSGLIMFAYEVKLDQISARTAMDHTMLDVQAAAKDGTTPTRDEFRVMMRWLLADRFRLQVHRETKEVPGYALVVGKSGPKFRESQAEARRIRRSKWTAATSA